MILESHVAAAIAAASRAINEPQDVEETLARIVEVARISVPGFDAVGVSTVDRAGTITTVATTGPLVQELDELQYALGEGPCVDTLRGAAVVIAPHIRREQRWSRYVPRAVEAGLRSQLAVRLFLDDKGTVGGLNLYSISQDDISADAEALAELFAAHAAIAFGHAREREGLSHALQSRRMIGQAIGILMERYQMNDDRAFAFLVRASSQTNVKLRDVAKEIVDSANAHRPA
jgi:GAF domain-containing protein